ELRIALGRDAAAPVRRAGIYRRRRRIDRRVPFVDAATKADLLVQPPSPELDACLAKALERVAGEAELVGVHVGGDEVGGALEQVVRDRDQQQACVDVQHVAAGDPGGRPSDPGVLYDATSAEVSELPDVRVVD